MEDGWNRDVDEVGAVAGAEFVIAVRVDAS